MGSASAALPIDYMAMLVNNWELIGQFMYPADGYRRLFELVRAGLLDPRSRRTPIRSPSCRQRWPPRHTSATPRAW